MRYIGISEGFHDAGMAVVDDGHITFATHAERHTKVKGERYVPKDLLAAWHTRDTTTIFYENTELKNSRRIHFGQKPSPICSSDYDLSVGHHESHMAAGMYTAPWDTSKDTVCVVIDAIGEFDTVTIWKDGRKVSYMKYPWSLGLFYSAITKRIGLKPNEDEYITMGMAAYGEPCIDMSEALNYNNTYHRGIPLSRWFWHPIEDIAASAQAQLEIEILEIMTKARAYGSNLVYGGGVALNCVANSKIRPMFDNMWIFPSPGDAGSALGCILAHTKQRVKYYDSFLGVDCRNEETNPRAIVEELLYNKIVGVCNGREEFGPRALGNRSLLADVRHNSKDTVNRIKRRQRFRPFAPAILSEYYDDYFEGYANEYMQFTAKAKHDYDSVTHVDGSARVQIVKPSHKSILRPVLEEYYEKTGIPMLLNTSLNIKGKPMVSDWEDAEEFERETGVKVF